MNRHLILCLALLTISCIPAGAQVVPKTMGAQMHATAQTDESLLAKDNSEAASAVSAPPKTVESDAETTSEDQITIETEPPAKFDSDPSIVQKPVTPSPMVPNATSVPSVITTGDTVRQPGLQNAEALTNIIGNGVIILGISWAGPSLIAAFMRMSAGESDGLKCVLHVVCALVGLMAIPGVVNWLVAAGRDAGVFVGW